MSYQAGDKGSSMTHDEYIDAFLAACDKQAYLEPHTPGWKPLLEMVWDELQERRLTQTEARKCKRCDYPNCFCVQPLKGGQ
jgi:hypothetical protein